MVDEPGYRRFAGQQAPDFLTVLQTAEVLQVGRSTAYELVGRYVATNGAEGIPAILVGGQYRVPRARLEEATGQPISWPPAPRQRRSSSRRVEVEEVGQQPVIAEVDDGTQPHRSDADVAVEHIVSDHGAIRLVSGVPSESTVDVSGDSQPPLPFAG